MTQRRLVSTSLKGINIKQKLWFSGSYLQDQPDEICAQDSKIWSVSRQTVVRITRSFQADLPFPFWFASGTLKIWEMFGVLKKWLKCLEVRTQIRRRPSEFITIKSFGPRLIFSKNKKTNWKCGKDKRQNKPETGRSSLRSVQLLQPLGSEERQQVGTGPRFSSVYTGKDSKKCIWNELSPYSPWFRMTMPLKERDALPRFAAHLSIFVS